MMNKDDVRSFLRFYDGFTELVHEDEPFMWRGNIDQARVNEHSITVMLEDIVFPSKRKPMDFFMEL